MKNVLIIADIEGSTGCLKKSDSQLFTNGWRNACFEMTKDINAVIKALFDHGVQNIIVKDFHRTGYNIIPEILDKRAKLVQGYYYKPVFGIGKTYNTNALMMIGLHAASGTEGFIPHTLTSKFSKIMVNNRFLTEAELFASSVFNANIAPIFFSGCHNACQQAKAAIPQLNTLEINKPLTQSPKKLRKNLAKAAVESLENTQSKPFIMKGPFEVKVFFRDGEKAVSKSRKLWKLSGNNDHVEFSSQTFAQMYKTLLNLAYLHPILQHREQLALSVFNLWGRSCLSWVKSFPGKI